MKDNKVLSKPYIGWVEFSETDQKKVKEFLANFSQEGTLDELGFGIIRDAFAEKLFPATSTIMTRARYFIFLPTIMRTLEKNKVKPYEYLRRLKEKENKIREVLSINEPNNGVIGETAKERLLRYPSNIYWNSLKKLNIFINKEIGLNYYVSQLDNYYEDIKPSKDDDGRLHLDIDSDYSFWDREFPYYEPSKCPFIDTDGNISNKLNFKLLKDEAIYLKEVYSKLGFSLLSFCLSKNKTINIQYPWEITTEDSDYNEFLLYCQLFSWLTNGLSIIYYQLLAEKKKDLHNYSDSFERWYYYLINDFRKGWQVDKFIEICSALDAIRIRDKFKDIAFFKEISSMLISYKSPKQIFKNNRIRDLIVERERIKRPVKARLKYNKYLEQWKSPDKINEEYFLNYRNPSASIIINDIIEGIS